MAISFYFRLPEFDDFKSCSISSETESMFRRIVDLVPKEFLLEERKADMTRYLEAGGEKGKKKVDFAGKYREANKVIPKAMCNLFYLLGKSKFNGAFISTLHHDHGYRCS